MENSILKLAHEYQSKIDISNVQLSLAADRKSEARGQGKYIEVAELNKEIAIINGQLQSYIQARVDIESLLDSLHK